ncbi:hypothetical protein BDB13_3102 [Rhodococcus sp. OK302]|nr:hypothetical protein BDB13_3102 [Rhodococcus sp. OK302]
MSALRDSGSMSAPDTVLIVLKRSRISFLRSGAYRPFVTINGHTDVLPWGEHRVSIPDAQPLSIDIYVNVRDPKSKRWTFGRCDAVVPPGIGRVVEYSAPAQESFKGDLGPSGTTRSHGLIAQALIVGALGLLCALILLGFLGMGLAALSGELR